ncbi:hypothetical protein ATX68_12790 [Oenococcus oeni]|uniref:Uncharacterized protein n=1 Tax=Oenococcus phage phiS13 TaxID=1432848 RepID=V5USN9_9CAUD|nr:hypothetical protein [Oenococcus oeni]YP_009005225.1 hypothetical protein CF85_gp40 [Oenococcus phage phiS13]AHB80375.1 hypothetical protein [Oenococcus phage phiS13]KGH62525.1 hypothetical protein X375_05320 [Oenococcus oeni S13]OIK55886.1 hypothetical protein ATW61_10010 [Oenococcus oeni]OIM37103.1 hypothetical protein ATX68_12790 [Oenococcus oeni]OIM61802.1 hypothetical protein ATX87_09760 [Oenococcus oeni]
MKEKLKRCALCGKEFKESELSEEHYPARNTGNVDIVGFDIVKFLDFASSPDKMKKFIGDNSKIENVKKKAFDLFDNYFSKSIYPKGRTTRTLCRSCNTFLGDYDEAYKLFFEANGNPQIIKGFQNKTKLKIIKSLYGKFLSLPSSKNVKFDFIDFVKNVEQTEYDGIWGLYCIKRDNATDLMGIKSLDYGRADFDEGIVLELSDEKFIYHLINFPPHCGYTGMNMFGIRNKKYRLVSGRELNDGGYHGQIMIQNMFEENGFI